jgi:hypothetical protein
VLALQVVAKYCTEVFAKKHSVSQFVPHRMQECINRVTRMEGSILTLAGQVFQGQSATTSALVQLQEQMQHMMSMVSSIASSHKRPAKGSIKLDGTLLPGIHVSPPERVSTGPKLCAFCDATCKRCTATTSLRHMLSCDQCSPTSCRHFSISEHLFSYKNEPLVGPMGECCWCGNPWDKCTNSSSSQSPKSADAQSKHKKSCHVICHKALQSRNPATVAATKAMLDRIWSNINVVDRKIKRVRSVNVDGDGVLPPELDNFENFDFGSDVGSRFYSEDDDSSEWKYD